MPLQMRFSRWLLVVEHFAMVMTYDVAAVDDYVERPVAVAVVGCSDWVATKEYHHYFQKQYLMANLYYDSYLVVKPGDCSD